jgi:gliding motility-associated-like protein
MRKLIFIFLLISTPVTLLADSEPYLSFTWEVTDGTGEPVASKDQHYEGSAPITAKMTVKMVYQDATGETRDYDDATFYGGWRRWKQGGQMEIPDVVNPTNPVDFTFRTSGTDSIAYVGYVEVGYDDYIKRIDITPEYNRTYQHIFSVKTYDSKLVFPNAFSPNGDEYNEKYKAKEVQSIVEFHAAIYNRWGQKLYEWSDVNDGWDGKYNGKDVKDGVYYVQVKAKGADGQVFVIKKDVNLLRGFEQTYNNTTE